MEKKDMTEEQVATLLCAEMEVLRAMSRGCYPGERSRRLSIIASQVEGAVMGLYGMRHMPEMTVSATRSSATGEARTVRTPGAVGSEEGLQRVRDRRGE